MPSIFRRNAAGVYYTTHDPDADLIYGITSWIEGRTFATALGACTWAITESGSPSPNLHNPVINAVPVVLDGVTYAIGEVATTWVTGLIAGVTYTLTLHATVDDGQRDDRSVSLVCSHR